jgi:hypothetical protein
VQAAGLSAKIDQNIVKIKQNTETHEKFFLSLNSTVTTCYNARLTRFQKFFWNSFRFGFTFLSQETILRMLDVFENVLFVTQSRRNPAMTTETAAPVATETTPVTPVAPVKKGTAVKKTAAAKTPKADKADKAAPKKTPAKKAAPKAEKKAAAKKTPAKAAKTDKTPKTERAKKDGLRKPQERILKFLLKKPDGQNRNQISAGAPCDLANCVELLGSHDPVKREANDAKHYPSLLSLGYIKAEQHEATEGRDQIIYKLTAAGRKAAEKIG